MSSADRSRLRTRSPEKVSTKSAAAAAADAGVGFGGLVVPGGGGKGLEEDEGEGGGGSVRRRWFAEPLDSWDDGGGDVALERWRLFAHVGASRAQVRERVEVIGRGIGSERGASQEGIHRHNIRGVSPERQCCSTTQLFLKCSRLPS